MNSFKAAIARWHDKQEASFLKRILPVADNYIREIETFFTEYLNSVGHENILLDIGGGEGRWSFLGQSTGQKYLSLDAYHAGHIKADAHALCFKDNSIRSAICFELLEHCRCPEKVISEIYRVLKDSGGVVLSTRQYWKTHGSPADYFRFTRQCLTDMFSSSGFEVVRSVPMGGPASIIATVIDQNIALFQKPLMKQIFLYPLWWAASLIDRNFFFKKAEFINSPDTTGWLIFARKRTR